MYGLAVCVLVGMVGANFLVQLFGKRDYGRAVEAGIHQTFALVAYIVVLKLYGVTF